MNYSEKEKAVEELERQIRYHNNLISHREYDIKNWNGNPLSNKNQINLSNSAKRKYIEKARDLKEEIEKESDIFSERLDSGCYDSKDITDYDDCQNLINRLNVMIGVEE